MTPINYENSGICYVAGVEVIVIVASIGIREKCMTALPVTPVRSEGVGASFTDV